MDYKYIEQLLEQYFQCNTSVEEEEILRAFFRQKEVPAHLLPYKALFAYYQEAKEVKLGNDFDAKLLARIEQPVVKMRRLTLAGRMKPLFKAAAVVAIMVALGTAAQRSFYHKAEEYNYDTYKDTYTDPQVAYGEITDALMEVSESINKYQEQQHAADSANHTAGKAQATPDSIAAGQ